MTAVSAHTPAAVVPGAEAEHGDAGAARRPEREADARAGGAGEAGPLGSTQSNFSHPCDSAELVDRRRVRWAARAALWRASTLYPVRTCGARLAPVIDRSTGGAQPVERHAVGVKRSVREGRLVAGYSGLSLCGSVWACPRCSAVVAVHRSAEIAGAVAECHRRGGRVHFLTLTLRHRRADALADLFDILHAGWHRITSGRAWAGDPRRGVLGDRDVFGIAGFVRVLEATVSRPGSGGHGWHLHAHVLLFSVADFSRAVRDDAAIVLGRLFGHPVEIDRAWLGRVLLHCRIAERWACGVQRAGGRVPGAAAVDLVEIADGGADFVGRYLAKSTYDVATRLGAEVAAGDLTKSPRDAANTSPFGLLAELVEAGPRFGFRTPRRWEIVTATEGFEVVDLDTGEAESVRPPGAWRLWSEWEAATAGRRQLAWALRPRTVTTAREALWVALLDARGADAEVTDDDLAQREIDGHLLGEIARSAWYARLVWHPGWLVDLLEAAERGGRDALTEWCAGHGVDFQASEPVR